MIGAGCGCYWSGYRGAWMRCPSHAWAGGREISRVRKFWMRWRGLLPVLGLLGAFAGLLGFWAGGRAPVPCRWPEDQPGVQAGPRLGLYESVDVGRDLR